MAAITDPVPVSGICAGLWTIAQMIVARSSRGDALFHAAMLACVLGGGLVAGNAGDWIWQSSNRGVGCAAVPSWSSTQWTALQSHCSMFAIVIT